MAQARLARVLMLQGFIEQAEAMGQAALKAAQRIDHKLSICFALGEAVCPLALITGDLAAAEASSTMLTNVATRHNFGFWTRLASCLKGSLLIRRGNLVSGTSLLRTGLDAFIRSGQRLYNSGFVPDLARGLAESGYAYEAAAIMDEELLRSDADGVRWHMAELLRVKGELMLQTGKHEGLAAADRCFASAIEEATRQDALFWELRATASLANLRVLQGQQEEARQLLAPVYGRFTEGFEAADLIAARTILSGSPSPDSDAMKWP
jgi:predicted ATPase